MTPDALHFKNGQCIVSMRMVVGDRQPASAYEVIGGGLPRDEAHTELKKRLRARIQDALAAVTDPPPTVVVRRSGPLAGAAHVVNRVTARGNGIQLEQPAAVRTDEQLRDAIAGAVAAFYAELV